MPVGVDAEIFAGRAIGELDIGVAIFGIAIFHLGEGVGVDRAFHAATDAPAVQLERGVGRFISVARQHVELAVGIAALDVDERRGVGEDTGARADIEITALADAAEPELVGRVEAIGLGGGAGPFTFDANHGAAEVHVVTGADAVEQTVDRLVVAVVIIVDIAAGTDMIIAQDRFDAGTGEGRADILCHGGGGDCGAAEKGCDHQLTHILNSIVIPLQGRDAESRAEP